MITIRKAEGRGATQEDWLDSRHTFSFADYHDPEHMGFRALRVINDDRIMGGTGFGMHTHRDMEIVTVMHEGTLEHRDSMGNKRVLAPGMVQRMSAGTGVMHSEMNASATVPAHLLQIWIMPAREGKAPEYEEKSFADVRGLRRIISPDGRGGSLRIHQQANVFLARLPAGGTASLPCSKEMGYWIQIIDGALEVNRTRLETGDGASTESEKSLEFTAAKNCEFLVFETR